MNIDVHIVNAFIDGDTGGNPAGVVVDANRLTTEQKLIIAQRVGISETAFVSSSVVATIKLDFFTPTRQIAHCGHATIATFSLLRHLGMTGEGRYSKETIDGTRDIIIDGEMAFMEQRAPKYTRIEYSTELGRKVSLSLGHSLSLQNLQNDPFVVNTGNSFLVVQLPDEQAVATLQPQFDMIEYISEELDLIGYYVFSTETRVQGRHAGTRMFAPRFGIPEESATGMAAGPLACFLHDRRGVKDRTILIEQGWLMLPPSPSVINVLLELENDKISRLMAGGSARLLSTTHVEI